MFINPRTRNCSNGIRFTQHNAKAFIRHQRLIARAQTPVPTIPVFIEDVILQFQNSAGSRRLARAVKPDGKRNWIVSDSNGAMHSITSKQVTFSLGLLDPTPTNLSDLEESCRKRAEESSELMHLVWETVSDDDEASTPRIADIETISDIVFSDSSPLSLYTTHLVLSEDRKYFKERKIKGEVMYEARPLAQVEELLKMRALELDREELLKKRLECFARAHREGSLEPLKEVLDDTELNALLEALKSIAVENEGRAKSDTWYSMNETNAFRMLEKRDKDLVMEVMLARGEQIMQSTALETLIAWEACKQHENLALLHADIPHIRPRDTTIGKHVEELLQHGSEDLDKERRTDFSHMTAYAIDSADTTEVDDAISWDPETNRVLVHIADPTRYFPEGPSHPLVQEALRRAATLYLPEEKFTLFPAGLAEKLFSLDGIDSDGSALTVAFAFDNNGALIEGSISVEPSKIAPPLRLTYEEVEVTLSQSPRNEDDEILHILYEKAVIRSKWREIEGGAIFSFNPLNDIRVQNAEQPIPDIEMKALLTDTPAWILVSEMMVTACSASADIAVREKLPVPFRGQEPFDYPEDGILDEIPNPIVRASLIFRNATTPRVSTEPMEHATLGLDAYLQVTSPIRRSVDLLSHFQIKASLRGDSLPFSVDDMEREILRYMEQSRIIRQLENRRKQYWQLVYLHRLGQEFEHECTFVRLFKEGENRLALVHLDEYGFSVVASVPSTARPGDKLLLKFHEIKPRMGHSRSKADFARPKLEEEDLFEIMEDAFSDVSAESES